MKPIDEQGYLIVATNTDSTNYVDCSYQLAQSIKYWHPDAKICLLTNTVENPAPHLFNYVHEFPQPTVANAYANDWQVFHATPFRETIKLEADMIVTSPIDHWWDMVRHREVVVSTGCRDWKDTRARSRHYRKVFDANDLPDVYNAITYWRLSLTAKEFFDTVQAIFENWSHYRALLKFPEDVPSTDVVYAIAAKIVGVEKCTMPFASYPTIVHMKRHIMHAQREDWMEEFAWEYQDYLLRINTRAQWGAVHYNQKRFRVDTR